MKTMPVLSLSLSLLFHFLSFSVNGELVEIDGRAGAILTLGDFYPNQIPTGELDPVGLSHHLAVLAAITDNNDVQPENPNPVLLVILNEFNNGLEVSSSAAALALLSQGVSGLIGPVSSSAAEYTQVTAAQTQSTPMISGAADSSTLSNQGEYPFFLSVYPSNIYEANGIAAMLDKYEAKTVAAFLRSSESSSESLIKRLFVLSESSDWKIVKVYGVSYGDTDFTDSLNDLATLNADVVLLFPWDTEITAMVFSQAYQMGLAGGDSSIQWIVDDYSLTQFAFQIGGTVSETAVKGWENAFGFVARRGGGDVYQKFLESYHREWYKKFTNNEEGYPETPDPKAAYSYDAVFVYYNAIYNMLALGSDPFDGRELNRGIRNVRFQGATGFIEFAGTQRAGEIPFDLWVARNGTLEVYGYSYNGQVSIDDDFHWTGNGVTIVPQILMVAMTVLFVFC